MENITKQRILESIGKIYEEAKNSKLESTFFKAIDNELTTLSQYFKTTKSQTFFISIVFALNYKSGSVSLNDLIDYFDCNPMKVLEYNDDFEYMYTKGILKKHKSFISLEGEEAKFKIHEMITEAILQDLPMPEVLKNKIEDVIELLEKVYDLGSQRDDELISTRDVFYLTKKLIVENTHFPFIKKIHQFDFDIEDTHIYLYLVWKTLSGNENVDVYRALEGIYDNASKRLRCMQELLTGNHILIKNNLIEIVEARFFNDTGMKLTKTSHQLLSDCDIKLFLNKKKRDDI